MKRQSMFLFLLLFLGVNIIFVHPAFCVTIDFEPTWPSGVAATSPFDHATPVNPASILTNQYNSYGVTMQNVALVNFYHPAYYPRDPILYPLGSSAYSGIYGISPMNSSNQLDYTGSMTFEFFDGSTSSVTNYFSIATDRDGGSGFSVTLYAFDFSNELLGSTTWTETGNGGTILELSGIGNFHKVIVQENAPHGYAGIAFDLVSFASPATSVPEPSTMLLLGSGLIGLVGCGRMRMKK